MAVGSGVSAMLATAPCQLSGPLEAALDRYDLLFSTGPARVRPEQAA